MKLLQNHRYLTIVIASSLVLLAILEGIWLTKLYNDERSQLRESINQTLATNMARLQITYMQRNNVRLIDSFLSEKEQKERENANLHLPLDEIFKKSQETYLATLDTISSLKLGSESDNKTIDSFMNVMRVYYLKNTPSVKSVGNAQKDTLKWVNDYIKNQKACVSSLWHIYTLKFSPQLNRSLMDSFFIKTKKNNERDISNIYFRGFFFSTRDREKIRVKRINEMPINLPNIYGKNQAIQIFISSDSNNQGKQPSKRDSFLSIYAYDFQKYVSGLIKPAEVKALLDTNFKAQNLTFDVLKLDAKELVPKKGDALIVTIPIGSDARVNKEKLGVAVYGYKPLIFKNIASEILFALFVFMITAVSFWLVFKSFNQQKRLIELKNDFISNMTHELKTPITTVGVAIEAMKSFDALKNPEQTKEYLDISKNELNRLSFLVDKVLKMAAFEQKEPILTLETFDMAELAQQVIDSMKLQFEKFNATVDFDKNGDDFNINADKTHITSVIYNLMDNALKYGGEKPVIRLELQSPFYDYVRVSVSDKGKGIPPQYLDKIFDKFFRIPTGDVHNTKGHGLGLSYVASVIKQHGGKINVESEEGQGSRFSVFLPLIKPIEA